MNAEAAINKLAEMKVGDRNRVAIGGHSYGAFMTANLLAHTNLFKAGIARSGAYNRTLTPFGFQNEARTYWEAPELYFAMSPFSNAHQIKTPLLLLHGQADPITSWIATQEFYELAGPTDKTLRLYPDFAHETHNERDRHVVLNDITDWLNHRCIDSLRSDDQKIA